MKTLITMLFTALLITSCVQKEHKKTITFNVDMSAVENPTKVGIRGNFTSPPWQQTVYLTDENNDGIYSTSLSRETAIYGIEFKFVNNDTNYELQGKDNRQIVFEYKPENIVYSATFNNPEFKIQR